MRRYDSIQQHALNPIQTNIFGIDIPLKLVLRISKYLFGCLIIGQSMKYFFIVEILSPVQSNN